MILFIDLENNNSDQGKLKIAIKSQKPELSIGKEIINLRLSCSHILSFIPMNQVNNFISEKPK
jgi:hypothetical protein